MRLRRYRTEDLPILAGSAVVAFLFSPSCFVVILQEESVCRKVFCLKTAALFLDRHTPMGIIYIYPHRYKERM